VGNPPFLGGSKLLRNWAMTYVETMRQIYAGRVPGGADLVCYWFEKARAQIEAGQAQRAGLVATNSIRGGQNRKVLERIRESSVIFNAWSDEPWINEGRSGAGVAGLLWESPCANAARPRLSEGGGEGAMLNGQPVAAIHADLTAQVAAMQTRSI
jgi:hypothetical protein